LKRRSRQRSDPRQGLAQGIDALGPYHLLRLIAAGGMASVWHAVDARDGREVALKRLLPRLRRDPDARARFADEGALCLRLRHPNLLEALERGEVATEHGTEPYLVLPLLRGRALSHLVHDGRALPLEVALRIVHDAARGLHHAHTLLDEAGKPLGLVHCDVSPYNVFVCDDGSVKVIDFGVARTGAARTDALDGTIAYVAPERLRGHCPDARADVFSLGVLLHELLVGGALFEAETEEATLLRVVSLPLTAPESLRPELPASIGAITLRALKRDRDRRLPSAATLGDAIEAVARAEKLAWSNARVAEHVARCFPSDPSTHAERSATARRLVRHLAGRPMRPAEPTAAPPRRARRRRWFGASAAIALLSLTALAAAATALIRHHAPATEPSVTAPAAEAVKTTAAAMPPRPTPRPAAAATRVAPPSPTRRRRAPVADPGCSVYVTLRGGVSAKDCAGKRAPR
jgi:serine/threonine protein kinase